MTTRQWLIVFLGELLLIAAAFVVVSLWLM